MAETRRIRAWRIRHKLAPARPKWLHRAACPFCRLITRRMRCLERELGHALLEDAMGRAQGGHDGRPPPTDDAA